MMMLVVYCWYHNEVIITDVIILMVLYWRYTVWPCNDASSIFDVIMLML